MTEVPTAPPSSPEFFIGSNPACWAQALGVDVPAGVLFHAIVYGGSGYAEAGWV